MTHALVGSVDAAVENIARYQAEVAKEPGLAARMKRVRAWYAVRLDGGTWMFGPSKFIGYANSTAGAYLSRTAGRDGRRSEAVLREWFDAVSPDTPLWAELADALRRFLTAHGHDRPHRSARICVRKAILAGSAARATMEPCERIRVDPAICGGRPHIRGTRVRVSDILDLLASGASPSEVLADYPYLSEVDLRAALAYGAAATEHRVILAA